MMDEDEILSADTVFSTQEILAEYQRVCEEAAETHSLDAVKKLAADVCRVLDRNHAQRNHNCLWREGEVLDQT